MSLLEDVFLADEANEAQELERIIEGDEYDGRPPSDSDENSEKEDEAEEDKKRVDPTTTKTRRVVKHPRFILNPARLTGPRGIQVIPEHFKDFKFKGKGHEKEDLDLMLKKLEHWAYRLYPKFQFEDCLKKIETLGKKRPVMVHLQKIRSDQFLSEETVVQKDSSDEEPQPEDEFDKLLQQQIELARSTPAPESVKKVFDNHMSENRPVMVPKATSSPSISEEQRERMLRNRKLAEERRMARLKNITNTSQGENKIQSNQSDNVIAETHNENEVETEVAIKRNRSNVIESSDEDDATVNKSITADVHNEINDSSGKLKSSNIIDTNDHENVEESNEIEMVSDDNVRENHNSDNIEKRVNVNDKNEHESVEESNDIAMVSDDNVQNDNSGNIDKSLEINENGHKRVKESNGVVSDDNILQNDKSVSNIDTDGLEQDEINKSDNSHSGDIDNNDIIIANSNNCEPDNNVNKIIEENNEKDTEKEKTVNSSCKKIVAEVNIENLDDLMDIDFSDDF